MPQDASKPTLMTRKAESWALTQRRGSHEKNEKAILFATQSWLSLVISNLGLFTDDWNTSHNKINFLKNLGSRTKYLLQEQRGGQPRSFHKTDIL